MPRSSTTKLANRTVWCGGESVQLYLLSDWMSARSDTSHNIAIWLSASAEDRKGVRDYDDDDFDKFDDLFQDKRT